MNDYKHILEEELNQICKSKLVNEVVKKWYLYAEEQCTLLRANSDRLCDTSHVSTLAARSRKYNESNVVKICRIILYG